MAEFDGRRTVRSIKSELELVNNHLLFKEDEINLLRKRKEKLEEGLREAEKNICQHKSIKISER